MMTHLTVIYDASVLYPAPLRDFLMRLALTDLFRARWTADIHAEWSRNVLKSRPDLTPEQLERTRALMDANVRDCVVEGYQSLIPSLQLPDPDDRHVLAAAIRAQASVIVTFNLKDFPAKQIEQYSIEAQHPDAFIEHLLEVNPAKVCVAAAEQRKSLRNPAKTQEEFLDILCKQGLPQTVAILFTYSSLTLSSPLQHL
jgi:predicted nucleic acid-binding protein